MPSTSAKLENKSFCVLSTYLTYVHNVIVIFILLLHSQSTATYCVWLLRFQKNTRIEFFITILCLAGDFTALPVIFESIIMNFSVYIFVLTHHFYMHEKAKGKGFWEMRCCQNNTTIGIPVDIFAFINWSSKML